MKNYFLSILSIFMLLGVSEVYSQCCSNPLDEVTITRDVVVNGDTCQIDITFCHSINPSGTRYIKLCSVDIPYGCNWTNIDFSGAFFWDIIYSEVLDYSDDILSFPPCGTVNQSTLNIEVKKAECWKIINDPIAQMSRIVECTGGDPADCYIEYVVCWENGVLTKTVLNRYTVGESSCYYEGPVYNDPFDPNPDPPFCFETCY